MSELDFSQIERYMNNERTPSDILKDDIAHLEQCIENMTVANQFNVNTATGIGRSIIMDMTFVFGSETENEKEYEFSASELDKAYELLAEYRNLLANLENTEAV